MIDLQGVHKAFGANKVLQGVDLHIGRGQSMVIIGGSGTGKSVMLKSVLGLVRHDTGSITVDGQDVGSGDRDAFLARFGMLFQGGALFDSLRVWENVAFRLLRGALKRPREEAREIAIEKLRRVGLKPEVADLFPAEVSDEADLEERAFLEAPAHHQLVGGRLRLEGVAEREEAVVLRVEVAP